MSFAPARRLRPVALLAAIAALWFGTLPVRASDEPSRELTTLAVTIDGEPYRLEALILTPPGAGLLPLAVITHGSPRDASVRQKMTTLSFLPQATEFARRGYLTAIVMRRGYGRSEGRWFEAYGTCDYPDYEGAARTSAGDLLAALDLLRQRPQVDPSRILMVGLSAGGIGVVAASSANPPGVVGVINFAGGRGSRRHGEVCAEDRLVETFGALGKTARVPSLWVYAENDGYFAPALASAFHEAYTASGGVADLIQTGPFGRDGHHLFSGGGIPIWRPLVDDFLRKAGLPTWETPPPPPLAPDVPPPAGLSERGKGHWKRYVAAPDNKAFAIAPDGTFGWRSGRHTIDDAQDGALTNCKGECRVISVNGKPVEESALTKKKGR